MKKDAIYLAIIIILLGIVVIMTCSGPELVDGKAEQYKDSVKVLQSQKAQISSRIEAIERASIVRQKDDSAKLATQEKEIARLKVKASQARTPRVDTLIKSDPELIVFVETQESVIQEQGVLIDTLKNQVAFERGVREQLTSLHYDANKITSNLLELKDYRIVALEKDLKREKRKNRGWKALAVVGTVLGFLGGSQL